MYKQKIVLLKNLVPENCTFLLYLSAVVEKWRRDRFCYFINPERSLIEKAYYSSNVSLQR